MEGLGLVVVTLTPRAIVIIIIVVGGGVGVGFSQRATDHLLLPNTILVVLCRLVTGRRFFESFRPNLTVLPSCLLLSLLTPLPLHPTVLEPNLYLERMK